MFDVGPSLLTQLSGEDLNNSWRWRAAPTFELAPFFGSPPPNFTLEEIENAASLSQENPVSPELPDFPPLPSSNLALKGFDTVHGAPNPPRTPRMRASEFFTPPQSPAPDATRSGPRPKASDSAPPPTSAPQSPAPAAIPSETRPEPPGPALLLTPPAQESTGDIPEEENVPT